MRDSRRAFFATVLSLALVFSASNSWADRDLTEPQGNPWLGQQFGFVSALTLANVTAMMVGHPARRANWRIALSKERGVHHFDSPLTAKTSDVTLLTSLLVPYLTLSAGGRPGWGNAALVYTEAIEASLLTNTIVKRVVRRARPYTYGVDAEERVRAAGGDAYYSFYSGHSALSFTAATASSVLFSSMAENQAWELVHAASTFALAGWTAHARVRAGVHYPGDVLVGAAAGIAWGVVVPLAHRVDLGLSPYHVLAAAGGTALGAAAVLLLPHRVGLEKLPEVTPVPGGAHVSVRLDRWFGAGTRSVNWKSEH